MINLKEKKSKKTQWVSLFIDNNAVVYFDSFGIEYIPQEVLKKIEDKSITHNLYIIQDDDSIMGGFYCIAVIEYMIPRKNLLDYINLFSPNLSALKVNDKYGKSRFRSIEIDKTRSCFLQEIKYHDLMSEKHKKVQGFKLL